MNKVIMQEILLYIYEYKSPNINNIQRKFNLGFNDSQMFLELLCFIGILTKNEKGKYSLLQNYIEATEILNNYFATPSMQIT